MGAVIVLHSDVIARAHNLKESKNDVTAHAEILAIRKAAKKLGNWRLNDCVLYTTLEPCQMCAGAIIHSRINRVVFGAKDLRLGSLGANHRVETDYFAYSDSQDLLKSYFKQKRD